VVGPLPLSGSSPDGGIFAYGPSNGPSDPFRTTLTSSRGPDSLDGPDALAAAPSRRRSRDFAELVPLEGPALGLSGLGLYQMEMAVSPSTTGAAFLPAMLPLAEVRVGRDSHRSSASRWPILYSRIRPRTSLAAVAYGSAGLLLGLVAPDYATRLAAWKDDRRWKRRALFDARGEVQA
jgi:hypothetical protein